MKKIILFKIMAIFACMATAQEINYKFGEVSREEVEMQTYPLDSSAVAVVLKQNGYTAFDLTTRYLNLWTREEYRVKILKDEGTKYADIVIPYYDNDGPGQYKENIIQIEAAAYNMENGKVVRKKMSRKYIFKELVSGHSYVVKFSIPNVKKGTVIEYKFKRTFNSIGNLDPWNIQLDIPVKYSKYETHIPDYFIFKHEAKGYEKIDRKMSESHSAPPVNQGNTSLIETVRYEDLEFTAHDIPAIKEESFLWSIENYRTAIEFELEGVAFPGQIYEDYTSSWKDVREQLGEHSEFGAKLKMRNPLRKQTELLMLDSLSVYDKSVALFSFLKQNIKTAIMMYMLVC